jgi:hypothetical protein
VTENDQPRPDLDAAVDAVLPSLTAVSDDAAAAALRRTRIALAEARSARGLAGWRWGLAAAAALIVLASTLMLWRSRAPEPGSMVERRPANPSLVTTPRAPSTPPIAPVPVAPERGASATPAPRPSGRHRSVPVQATSAPTTPESSRPDPLIALVRAVQEIPEEAWNASVAQANAPIDVAELSVAPIVVTPLVTPPIADASPAPSVQGEP